MKSKVYLFRYSFKKIKNIKVFAMWILNGIKHLFGQYIFCVNTFDLNFPKLTFNGKIYEFETKQKRDFLSVTKSDFAKNSHGF